MFKPKKTIPNLAIAALALTGCGGNPADGDNAGGGMSGTGGNSATGGAAGAGGVVGTGGSSGIGGASGSGGTNEQEAELRAVIADFCKTLKERDPTTFSEEYGSHDDCQQTYASYFDFDNGSEECLTAYTEYIGCFASLGPEEFNNDDVCLLEGQAVETACPANENEPPILAR